MKILSAISHDNATYLPGNQLHADMLEGELSEKQIKRLVAAGALRIEEAVEAAPKMSAAKASRKASKKPAKASPDPFKKAK